ncbi:tetraspanin-11-like [Varroa jacobsoni]|uniref:tetraspanin-11-like n=1 Tax=Varroa jacobsoni TaxID=62625 RepID=UPI000BF602BC|nr:tetraspanin-11-like [Varroa jacobsoni]
MGTSSYARYFVGRTNRMIQAVFVRLLSAYVDASRTDGETRTTTEKIGNIILCYKMIQTSIGKRYQFFVILFMIFIILLVGGILGYVFRNEVGERMYQEMIMTIPAYGNDTDVTEAWDAVQHHFECCGVPGPTPNEKPYKIWLLNIYFNDKKQVPESCCIRKEWISDCQANPMESSTYMANCHTRVRDFVEDHARTVAGVGIGAAALLLIGMILSCTMAMMIQ